MLLMFSVSCGGCLVSSLTHIFLHSDYTQSEQEHWLAAFLAQAANESKSNKSMSGLELVK